MTGAEGADLGFVGEIDRVEPRVVTGLIAGGFIPVIAPMGAGTDGQVYNINADHAAGAIAAALGAAKLVYLTDVEGLYEDFGEEDSLLSKVTVPELEALLASGKLHSGMIPKIRSCIGALHGGVERAHILDGRVEHALLLEIFTDEGVGTMVQP
jgi:acetylglutamate kinase